MRFDPARREQRPQRLAQIPTVQVDGVDDGVFNDVAPLFEVDGEIRVAAMHVDEARIEFAVRRCEAPGPAARLDREQHAPLLLALGAGDAAEDLHANLVGNRFS